MRLGLFGGTFDPIHLGHLILAESCREVAQLDQVWFVVAGQPPHKSKNLTPIADRIEMARIAVAGHPSFEVSESEAKSPGPHYTYETLESIQREHPDDELCLIIGGDSLADLPGWREPGKILELATIIAVGRPGSPELSDKALKQLSDSMRITPRVELVHSPLIEISSTDLRSRILEGRSIRYQVPRGVQAYIEAQGLYQGADAEE